MYMNRKTSVSILGNKTSIKRKRQHAKDTNWFVLQTKVNKIRKFMLQWPMRILERVQPFFASFEI